MKITKRLLYVRDGDSNQEGRVEYHRRLYFASNIDSENEIAFDFVKCSIYVPYCHMFLLAFSSLAVATRQPIPPYQNTLYNIEYKAVIQAHKKQMLMPLLPHTCPPAPFPDPFIINTKRERQRKSNSKIPQRTSNPDADSHFHSRSSCSQTTAAAAQGPRHRSDRAPPRSHCSSCSSPSC